MADLIDVVRELEEIKYALQDGSAYVQRLRDKEAGRVMAALLAHETTLTDAKIRRAAHWGRIAGEALARELSYKIPGESP